MSEAAQATTDLNARVARSAERLLREHQFEVHSKTDRLFAGLMVVQWIAGIFIAFVISPRTWSGPLSSVHIHVWTAVLFGGVIAALPVTLAWTRPGMPSTRYVIAAGQMLAAALLIHLSGGRIETHFHIFGSLAFLAFYRDWKVFVPATLVVAADHMFRGIYWPQSVFGVLTTSPWRWVEHAAWVVFESVFLIRSCIQSSNEMREIADRRAQFEATNEIVEATVRERTAELQASEERCRAAMEQADAANLAKSEFLATMSHELRTPLNSVIGFSNILRKNKNDNLRATDLQYVGRILDNGKHLLALINDVLDVSRIEAGKVELQIQPVSVGEVVAKVVALQEPGALERGIELCQDIPADLATVEADATRLEQILINLVGNAIKFTERGSVTIRVGTDGSTSRPTEISVIDTGIGIPRNRLEAIFDKFQQADASTSRKYGGTGLGLAISNQLCRLMGFELQVESTLDQGSTFRLVLAKSEHAEIPEPLPAEEVEQAPGAPAARVLVIDDETDARFLLAHQLRELNCDVRTADNGRQGIEIARSWQPDLITLDLMMPGMNGFAVLRELKTCPEIADIPVVVVSVVAGDYRPALVGNVDALSKPVDREQLAGILQQVGVKAWVTADAVLELTGSESS